MPAATHRQRNSCHRAPFWHTVTPTARMPVPSLAAKVALGVIGLALQTLESEAFREGVAFTITAALMAALMAALPFISDIAKAVR